MPELILTAPTPEMDGFAAEGFHSARESTFSDAHLDMCKPQVYLTSEPPADPLKKILGWTIPGLKHQVGARGSRKSFPDYSGKVLQDNPRLSLTSGALSGATAILYRVRDKTEEETLAYSVDRNKYTGILKPIVNSWLWKRLSTTKTSFFEGPYAVCPTTASDNLVVQSGLTALPSSQLSTRHSGSPIEARVVEEGEHAASRLFGTPNTGTTRKKEKSGGQSYDRRKRNEPKVLKQPKRRSLGFDLWTSRRHSQCNK